MEESLCDLLERLSDVATGAANSHEKPSNIVEEVKDILDHLAEDELPSASAIFLAKVCLSTNNKTRFFPLHSFKKTNAQKKRKKKGDLVSAHPLPTHSPSSVPPTPARAPTYRHSSSKEKDDAATRTDAL